jgi:uncharacterized protein YjgD (DUF1641 family)
MTSPPAAPPSSGDEAILKAILGISERLDRIEGRIAAVEAQAGAALGALAIAGDTFDQRVATLAARGVDLDDRAAALGRLTEAATAPALLDALTRLVDQAGRHADRVEAAADAIEGLPGLVATVGDTVDQHLGALTDRGIDIDQRVRDLLALTERATRPEAVMAMGHLIDKLSVLETLANSAVLEPHAVALVGQAGRAMVQTREEDPPPAGLFAALSAIGRPDIQRALGFLLRFGERFGAGLNQRP